MRHSAIAQSIALKATLATLALVLVACAAPTAEPTPAEPTPAQPTPAQPTPAEPTPAEPTPAEPTPAEPTPAGETFTLVFTTHGTERETSIEQWFMREVESRSNGRITFEEHYLGSLCPIAETTRCVIDGRADFGRTTPSVTPADFPLTELMNIPFMSPSRHAIQMAYSQLMREVDAVRAEHEGQGLRAWYYTPSPVAVIGAEREFQSVADLSGLRIRTIGEGSQLAIEAIGGNPVTVVAGEMYDGMARGVLDVWVNNLIGGIDFNLHEVSRYWYEIGMGPYVNNGFWMSQQTFDSLPADLQQIIDEVAEEVWTTGVGMDTTLPSYEEVCDVLLQSNVEVFESWPQEAIDEWKNALGDAAADAWVARATEAGVQDARAIYDRYVELLREAEATSTWVGGEEACIERFATER